MSGPRTEDVKEALGWFDEHGPREDLLPQAHVLAAAARAWLASQEQTPDITDEMVSKAEAAYHEAMDDPDVVTVHDCFRAALDAALVGFHPGDKGDER